LCAVFLFTTAITANAGFLYVLNQQNAAANQIYCFRVTESSGSLDLVPGFPISSGGNGLTGTQSELMTMDTVNKRLYVINKGSNTVSAFTINIANGALTPMPFSPFTVVTNAVTIAVHPTGSPVVIGGNTGSPIAGTYFSDSYIITPTTATRATGSPFATGGVRPFSSAFSKDGDYFYTGGALSNSWAGFGADETSGVLAAVSGSPIAAGTTGVLGYATDTQGRIFTATRSDGGLRVYTTSAGTPTAVSGSPFATAMTALTEGELSPNEQFYVVVDSSGSEVGAYQITGVGAATSLSLVSGLVGTNGSTANSMAFNQTGTHFFVANSSTRNISRFTFNSGTGAISLIGVQVADSAGSSGFLAGTAYLAAAPPTAANVGVSGRVTTSEGRGISGVRVSISDARGDVRTALTNPFGYYRFDEVQTGATYLVNASAKGRRFGTQTVTVGDELTNLDITELP